MEKMEPDDVLDAAGKIELYCMHCGGIEGFSELLHTGDNESLGGFEVWFCCDACNFPGNPCDTFFRLHSSHG